MPRLDGSTAVLQLPRVFFTDERVLTLREAGLPSLHTGREVLMSVLAFVHSKDFHVTEVVRWRHATMLVELLARRCSAYASLDEPVNRLGLVAQDWIQHYVAAGQSLLASWAIDTASLIEVLAYGRRGHGRVPSVVGLLRGTGDRCEFSFLRDSQFRKQITEDVVWGTMVLATWPAHVRWPVGWADYAPIEPGQPIAVLLCRCHLSETRSYSGEWALDLAAHTESEWMDFDFDGYVVMTREPGKLHEPWAPGRPTHEMRMGLVGGACVWDLPVSLPNALITHEVAYDGAQFENTKLTPVPSWGPETMSPDQV